MISEERSQRSQRLPAVAAASLIVIALAALFIGKIYWIDAIAFAWLAIMALPVLAGLGWLFFRRRV